MTINFDIGCAVIETLQVALPTQQTVVLPGQQHVAMDTAPDLFVQAMLTFLQDEDRA